MKGQKMKQLKKGLQAIVMAAMLMTSVSGMAADKAGLANVGISAVSSLIGAWMTFCRGGVIVNMAPAWSGGWAGLPNVDAAQLVAEYMVLKEMKDVKDNWEPEPEKEYEQAAQNNGGGGGTPPENITDVTLQTLPFQVASLQNVGIEAIGVGPDLSEIATEETRNLILSDLGWLQPKGAGGTTDSDSETGAGSCGASYSVCLRDMTSEDEVAVSSLQKVNGQNYGTAGIAHAELGLKSVQQAIANDGGSGMDAGGTGVSSGQAQSAVAAGTMSVQNLSGLIGTGMNTAAAMKIVALMNLELAQRLNQGNMMQGSALTIEGARAFPNTKALTE